MASISPCASVEPAPSSAIARKLLETRVITVAAPSYLKRRGRPATPEDLARERHTCIEYRDPETGKPYPWEFHSKRRRITVATRGRLIVNDPATLLGACLAGYGVAQILELGFESLIESKRLVSLFRTGPTSASRSTRSIRRDIIRRRRRARSWISWCR